MTLKVFRLNASRLVWALPLVALVGCGPVDSHETDSQETPEASRTVSQAATTIGYRSSTTATGKSITALTITKPAGTVQGDVLLARITNRNNVAAVMTAPAGWTVLRSDQSASQIKSWVLYKVAGAAEPASYTFTIDLASYIAGSISAFSGVDTANPIDTHSGQKNGTTSAFNTPAIGTSSANGMAVWFGSQLWAGATCPTDPITPPAGFTEAFDACLLSSSTGVLYNAAYFALSGQGAQPAFNGSSPFANTNTAQVVALRAAGAPSCTVGNTYASTYTTVGDVGAPEIVEPSGLAASRINPGAIYVHNEDTTAIVAISPNVVPGTTTLQTRGVFNVANVTPADWEDVATGPCPTGSCIYMGDIGRSSANFPTPPNTFAVYRIPEPTIPSGSGPATGSLSAEKFPFQYPDSAKDAEALMVHPTTGDIYVITKSGTGLSKVYKFPKPLPAPGNLITLTFVSNLQLPTTSDVNFSYTTAAAIHPCDNRFILRTYRTVYEFRAPAGSGFEAAFAAAPVTLTDTSEGQGEAIEYAADGSAYFTMSESRTSTTPFRLKRVLRQ